MSEGGKDPSEEAAASFGDPGAFSHALFLQDRVGKLGGVGGVGAIRPGVRLIGT